MEQDVLSWLLSQLGPTTDADDLATRYQRLGTARAVALEVLAERRAWLLADPLRMTVDGVVTLDQSNNLTGTERLLAALADEPGPDEAPASEGDTVPELVAVPVLRARRRW